MNNTNTVLEFIRDMLVEMKDMEPGDLTPETSIDELGLDSLDYVEIKVNVSREFLVTLAPTLFETKIKTVGQLCTYIVEESAKQEV
ncbi:acyl carrier protein [Paraburkholderia sp. A1RI-2L]|uniref:acyl carrier protein n=1 Tax=Paraburkholderia sp. A1RI-2L TaxID=3028367 RepID=UPI003B7F6E87